MHPLRPLLCQALHSVISSAKSTNQEAKTIIVSTTDSKLRLRNLVILLLRHRGGISDIPFWQSVQRGFWTPPALIFCTPDHRKQMELLKVLDCHASTQPSCGNPSSAASGTGSKGQDFSETLLQWLIQTLLPGHPTFILCQKNKNKNELITCENLSSTEEWFSEISGIISPNTVLASNCRRC